MQIEFSSVLGDLEGGVAGAKYKEDGQILTSDSFLVNQKTYNHIFIVNFYILLEKTPIKGF